MKVEKVLVDAVGPVDDMSGALLSTDRLEEAGIDWRKMLKESAERSGGVIPLKVGEAFFTDGKAILPMADDIISSLIAGLGSVFTEMPPEKAARIGALSALVMVKHQAAHVLHDASLADLKEACRWLPQPTGCDMPCYEEWLRIDASVRLLAAQQALKQAEMRAASRAL